MADMGENWRVTVTDGLNAFFKQANGPSKPGTDWVAVLRRGSDERRVLVRTYCEESLQGSPQQASRAVQYVAELLNKGWKPENFDGFLTVPDEGGLVQHES